MNPTLFWAKRYKALGWSVIPLVPMGKEPLISPIPYRTRLATDEELNKWFTHGNNNIGIVCGILSNVAVIDLDGPLGLQGGHSIVSSAVTVTGKGKQLLFAYNNTIRNHVGLHPGIDTRAEGGYIVAPPSVHPNGKRYIWEKGPTNKLPSFPLQLIAVYATSVSVGDKKKPEGWLEQALENLKDGNRNATFTSICGRLHRSGVNALGVLALLRPHADRVGFAVSELETVIASVSKYARPQNEDSENVEDFLKDIAPVGWLCAPFFARKSIGFVAGLPETLKTWLLIDLAVECARGGGIWLGQFHCAPAKVLFIDQERFKGETQRRFKAVLKAKSLAPESIKGNLSIKTGSSIRLNLDQSFQAFKRELSGLRPDLVIVDSFATFNTVEENDRTAVQVVMDRLKELRNEFGCTFIFIDHENKSVYSDKENGGEATAFRMVGSVGKIAAAEFCLTVRKMEAGSSIVHHTKSTLAPASKSFYAQIQDTQDGGVQIEGKLE